MKQGGISWLLGAALALGSAIAVQATVLDELKVNDQAIIEDRLPRTLGEFGFFLDPAVQTPAWGVHPYELNTPLYSDGAEKLRFIYMPEGTKAEANGEGLLKFPVGSALIKTFAFGEGDKRRLIETRVLLHRADGWIALPYKWNKEQTDALLAIAGARLPITTPGGEEISYRIPNKNQCKECHGLDDEVVLLGPRARNLSAEWLAGFAERGWLDAAPGLAERLPVWADREHTDIEAAARAYLDVNCAHCHRPGAMASNSGLDLRWEQTDPIAIGVLKRPVAAGRGSGGLEFSIVPGDPDNSIMVHRMNSIESGVAMPELGKATVDKDGVAAVERWIAGMDR